MLPGFRLVVATFLLGFMVVFAGLRLATITHEFPSRLPMPALAAARMMPTSAAPPIASYAAVDDVPRREFAVPVMFNLDSVISATAAAPIIAAGTPVPAEFAPSRPEPTIAQAGPPAPPNTVAEETIVAETGFTKSEANAAGPAVAAPAESFGTEITGSLEPLVPASSSGRDSASSETDAAVSMAALNKLDEQTPVIVKVRLPRAKPPLRVVAKTAAKSKTKAVQPKTKTARAQHPRSPARQARPSDPFNFGSFDNYKPQQTRQQKQQQQQTFF
jgi:hypothetical protein